MQNKWLYFYRPERWPITCNHCKCVIIDGNRNRTKCETRRNNSEPISVNEILAILNGYAQWANLNWITMLSKPNLIPDATLNTFVGVVTYSWSWLLSTDSWNVPFPLIRRFTGNILPAFHSQRKPKVSRVN